MTDTQDRRRDGPHTLPRASKATFLWLALLALVAFVVIDSRGISHAAPEATVDIVYLSVTSEGSTARAWYDGGPSPGVLVQEALTKFAHEGYKVAELSQNVRASTDEGVAYVILLERLR